MVTERTIGPRENPVDPGLAKLSSDGAAEILWWAISGLMLISVFSAGALFSLHRAGWWHNHTHEVIEQIDDTERLLSLSDTWKRAYLTTGRPEDLAHAKAELTEAARSTQNLRNLIRDNAVQRPRAAALAAELNQALRAGSGSDNFFRNWPALSRMHQEEEKLLQVRTRRMALIRVTAIYVNLTLVVFSVAAFAIYRARWRKEKLWAASLLERLSTAEAYFHAFMDHTPLAAFIKDAQSRVIYANRAWRTFMGPRFRNADERNPSASLSDELNGNDRAVLSSGEAQEFVERVPDLNQELHDWLVVKFPFEPQKGVKLLGGLGLDVTEARQTQRALEISERRLRLALESAAMHVWEYDAARDEFETFFASLQAAGHPISESLKLECALERVSPEYRGRVKQALLAAAKGQDSFAATYRTVNGRWFVSTGSTQPDGTPEAVKVVGVAQDQTERIDVETKLAKLTKLHELILQSTQLALISFDTGRVVTSYNLAAERLLGYRAEEVIGGPQPDLWNTLCGDNGRELRSSALLRANRNSEQTEELLLARKDGTRVPVRRVVSPIYGDGEEVVGCLAQITDLSELKRANHQVRELNSALENTLSGWAQLDCEGRYVTVNRSYAQTTGYDAEEIKGMSWQLTVHPDDLPVVREAFETMMRTGFGEAMVRGLRKNGATVYKRMFMAPANDHLGNRIGSYCFLRDKTPEMQAQVRMAASDSRYRRLFDLNPLPSWIYDPRTLAILDANEAALQHYGYSREEFLKLTVREISVPDEAEDQLRALGAYENAPAGPALWHHSVRDGSVIDVELAARDLSESSRLVVVRDVTDERRAALKLRKSEGLLREAQQIARVGIWEFDTKSDSISWSPETSQIFGLSTAPNTLSYEAFLETIHPADRDLVAAAVKRSIDTMQNYNLEYRVQRADGSVRHVLGRGQYTNGSRRCLAGTVLDITEQKQIQDQLEQSLAEKEVLLKEIHHRVKNNLQIISCLLNIQAGMLDNTPAVSALQESERRVMAMALIHERLYSNSRMDRINFQEYAVTLVQDLVSSYSTHSSELEPEFDLEPIELTIEQALPCGLILNELVTNTLKYAYPAEAGGTLRVGLQPRPEGAVVLSVADQGRGLPEGFDLENSTSLGLTIVRLLTKQLGGKLDISSSNRGTSFSVTFPKLTDRYGSQHL